MVASRRSSIWAGTRSDERRLHRWRFENVLPYVPVAGIEDALHHAGVRLVEVYPETDVGEVFDHMVPEVQRRGDRG